MVTMAVAAFITYTSSEFALTDRRVLAKVGWLRRRALAVDLTKVESVGVNQGIFGRVFGYGTIVLIGTGGTREPFARIRDPLQFQHRVQTQMAAARERV